MKVEEGLVGKRKAISNSDGGREGKGENTIEIHYVHLQISYNETHYYV